MEFIPPYWQDKRNKLRLFYFQIYFLFSYSKRQQQIKLSILDIPIGKSGRPYN